MKRYERLAAVAFAGIGGAAAYHAYANLKLGTVRTPGSGFLPFWASLLLVLFSLLWLARSLGPDAAPQPFWDAGGWVRPLLAVLLLIAYAWTMEPVGYVLSTLAFLAAWQLAIERARWTRAAAVSLLGTAAMYVIFVWLLGVPVPPGILSV